MKYSAIIFFLFMLAACQISINKDHVAEGTKLIAQGDYSNAALEFDDALFGNRNNLDALRGKFVCAVNMGYLDKALDAANRFVELEPDSSAGYSDRGTVYMMKNDLDNAINDFDKGLTLDKDHPEILYFNKGLVLSKLNRNEEAIACYRFVILKDKKDARAHFRIGQAFSKEGVKDSACFFYSRAKELGDKEADKEFESYCK